MVDDDPHHDPFAVLAACALSADLLVALDELTPRERDTLVLRYGLDSNEPRTLEEVGMYLHVTRERVRQIEMRALKKLRKQRENQPFAKALQLG